MYCFKNVKSYMYIKSFLFDVKTLDHSQAELFNWYHSFSVQYVGFVEQVYLEKDIKTHKLKLISIINDK